MGSQLRFLDGADEAIDSVPNLIEGFHYQRELITVAEEKSLLDHVGELPFREFEFHGYLGKRRTVSFGWQYEFSGRGKLRKADDIPEFLLPLRSRAASFAGMQPDSLQHVLVIEYRPEAGIGWHKDKPVFGEVIGVSLLAPCILRFRRKREEAAAKGKGDRLKSNWERVNLLAEPRSAYHLSGPARSEWQHSILRVDSLRYSVTFRSMSEA